MMRNRRRRAIVSIVSVLLAVVVPGSPALAGDKSNTETRVNAWQTAFNAGDSAAVAAHYTLDAVRMP